MISWALAFLFFLKTRKASPSQTGTVDMSDALHSSQGFHWLKFNSRRIFLRQIDLWMTYVCRVSHFTELIIYTLLSQARQLGTLKHYKNMHRRTNKQTARCVHSTQVIVYAWWFQNRILFILKMSSNFLKQNCLKNLGCFSAWMSEKFDKGVF